MLKTPPLGIVVTAHRYGPMLVECLDGVARLDPPPVQVVVAIDGRCPQITDTARGRGFEVVEFENALGVSAARNAGAARVGAPFVAFLDSDVVPKVDFVLKAFAALRSQPGAVAAMGSYDDSPAAPGVVSRYRNLLHHFTHQHGNREAQTFWAACGICDAEVFRSEGGYDERYALPSIEDIELGYRLRRAGHRIALDPTWQIKHLKKWTWRDLVFTDIGRRAIPWTLLLLREGRLDNDLNIDTRSRRSALMVVGALASLPASFVSLWFLSIPLACLGSAIFLNRRFYRFLAQKGGWAFAAGAIPLHLFYFLAATIGWVLGHAIFRSQRVPLKK
jgi:GT2 family glycosyltransferase